MARLGGSRSVVRLSTKLALRAARIHEIGMFTCIIPASVPY